MSYVFADSVWIEEGWQGEGKGYLLQYSSLENSTDCIVHGVAKSQTRLRELHFHFHWLDVWPIFSPL